MAPDFKLVMPGGVEFVTAVSWEETTSALVYLGGRARYIADFVRFPFSFRKRTKLEGREEVDTLRGSCSG